MTNPSVSEFLNRSGVTTCLREVVSAVLENEPDDPFEFMAD